MKHKISEIGAQMLEYQEQLAREYKYKPIPRTFFCDVRAKFQKTLTELLIVRYTRSVWWETA